MKTTKKSLLQYLVDVLGIHEEESMKIVSIYGTSYLSKKQLRECVKFNK